MKKNKAVTLNSPAGDAGGSGASHYADISDSARTTRVIGLDRWLVKRILDRLKHPPICMVLWNGEKFNGTQKPTLARITIHDRGALYLLILRPHLYFGELYSAGRIKVEGNLVGFLASYNREHGPIAEMSGLGHNLLWQLKRVRSNTLRRARRNIHHHYDIGNDFYRLWLDRAYLQYTCAYYPNAGMTLEQAQVAKMEHICRKLRLQAGDTVVEAGCGWGGLARYMAKHYDVNIRSYNISHEQIVYAREQAKREGIDDRVEYVEDDYRNITGDYDVFVSIGMLEHVGQNHYRHLGNVIQNCLRPDGRGLLHSIGRNKPAPMNAWIDKRIFPGAYPPSLREMLSILEPSAFSILDVENLRLHYAQTLEHWLHNYEIQAELIKSMYDIDFYRAWRLYLAGSIAAFETGELQLFQLVFTRHNNNKIPSSRAHLYQ